MADTGKPGIQEIIEGIGAEGKALGPQEFVERCLDQVDALQVGKDTEAALLSHAESGGELRFGSESEKGESASRVARMLQLIVSSIEYQYG